MRRTPNSKNAGRQSREGFSRPGRRSLKNEEKSTEGLWKRILFELAVDSHTFLSVSRAAHSGARYRAAHPAEGEIKGAQQPRTEIHDKVRVEGPYAGIGKLTTVRKRSQPVEGGVFGSNVSCSGRRTRDLRVHRNLRRERS